MFKSQPVQPRAARKADRALTKVSATQAEGQPAKKKETSFYIDPEILKDFKKLAIDLDKTYSELIEETIIDLLRSHSIRK